MFLTSVARFLLVVHVVVVVVSLNLFESFDPNQTRGEEFEFANNVTKKGCEQSVLNELHNLNGTGAQSYVISERELQLCPNFCSNSSVLVSYCSSHQPDFVADFGAEVRSGRCCDNEKCVCVCHFDCKTIRHKADQFRAEGFTHCTWGSSRHEVMAKSRRTCKRKRSSMSCGSSEVFLCAHQLLCVNKLCLACANPCCVHADDKAVAMQMLRAQNDTEKRQMVQKHKKHIVQESVSSLRVLQEPQHGHDASGEARVKEIIRQDAHQPLDKVKSTETATVNTSVMDLAILIYP